MKRPAAVVSGRRLTGWWTLFPAMADRVLGRLVEHYAAQGQNGGDLAQYEVSKFLEVRLLGTPRGKLEV